MTTKITKNQKRGGVDTTHAPLVAADAPRAVSYLFPKYNSKKKASRCAHLLPILLQITLESFSALKLSLRSFLILLLPIPFFFYLASSSSLTLPVGVVTDLLSNLFYFVCVLVLQQKRETDEKVGDHVDQ